MGISDVLKNSSVLRQWQSNNPYHGAKFSILGDSISTYEGYNPEGYRTFYGESADARGRVGCVSNTWWKIVIDFFGAELLVNNAWSGSWVAKKPENDELFPSGCSDERTFGLHRGDEMPDVILVYLGVNDWYNGARVDGECDNELERFDMAYAEMLRKLQKNYPSSEIWCCTINTSYMRQNIGFRFPHAYAGVHVERYNAAIRVAAQVHGCAVIDLYRYNRPYETHDGSHPTEVGMATMAKEVIESMIGCDPEVFLATRKEKQPFETDSIYKFALHLYPLADATIEFLHDQESDRYTLSSCDEGCALETINLSAATVERLYRLLAGFPFAELDLRVIRPPRANLNTTDLHGNDAMYLQREGTVDLHRDRSSVKKVHFSFETVDGGSYECLCAGEPPADFVHFQDVLNELFENRQRAFGVSGMVPLIAAEKSEMPPVVEIQQAPPEEPAGPDYPCVCPTCRTDLQIGAIYCRLCGTHVAAKPPIPAKGVPDLPVQTISCKLCGAGEVFLADKFCYRCGKRPK